MTTNQVMEKYGLKEGAAYTARKKGFFVKNYSRPQVKVDPTKFNVALCYNIAGKVFWRNLSRDPVAMSIRDDLIQEAVKSMWEKSGLLKESKKYNINYQYYFVARNYMNSYLTKWKRQMQYTSFSKTWLTPSNREVEFITPCSDGCTVDPYPQTEYREY